jgi:quercetin dioxygenase-like cupin family protein
MMNLLVQGVCLVMPFTSGIPSAVYRFDELKAEDTPAGQRRKIIFSQTATLDALALQMTSLDPGKSPHPPHQHPDEEMVMIKEGTLQITINGKTEHAGPGSVIFVAPNDLHGWTNVGQSRAHYFVMRWTTAKTAAAL